MSFLEILLAQKGVVLLIVLAVLMLIAGVAFATLPGILQVMRKSTAARAARKLAQQRALEARLAAEAAANASDAIPSDETPSTATSPDKNAAAASASPNTEQPVVVQTVVVSSTAAPAPAEAAASTTKPETQTTSGSEKHASNAMQDILGSVFADEEANAQLAILMNGLGPVNINDLNELSRSIASQLASAHTNNH